MKRRWGYLWNGHACLLSNGASLRTSLICILSLLQVYQLETEYLGAEYSQCGTVLKVHGHTQCACPALLFILKAQEGKVSSLNAVTRTGSFVGARTQGFEGFLSSKDALRKRARAFKPEDRLFSLSSKTSIAVRFGI